MLTLDKENTIVLLHFYTNEPKSFIEIRKKKSIYLPESLKFRNLLD